MCRKEIYSNIKTGIIFSYVIYGSSYTRRHTHTHTQTHTRGEVCLVSLTHKCVAVLRAAMENVDIQWEVVLFSVDIAKTIINVLLFTKPCHWIT